jgi:hypothetical protein
MVWQFSGLAMVLYLAGLQRISDEVCEATLVDEMVHAAGGLDPAAGARRTAERAAWRW